MEKAGYRESDVRYIQAMATQPDPVLTAPELAELVGVTQQAAHDKLEAMRDRGLVRKKKVGAKAVVWWLTTDGLDVYRETIE